MNTCGCLKILTREIVILGRKNVSVHRVFVIDGTNEKKIILKYKKKYVGSVKIFFRA